MCVILVKEELEKGDAFMNLIIFWVVILVLCLALEFATAGLTSIWFALGAAGALVSTIVAPEIFWLQITIFLVISGLTLYFTRPLALKYFWVKETPTNANRVLDMVGMVRETVNNTLSTGTVYVGGKLWTARSVGEEPIEVGTTVDILRIEGVKLIVRPHVAATAEASSQKPGA